VLIQNINLDKALHAGLREKGSSLDRKIRFSPKTSTTLTVNADSNSKIETYAEDNKNIKFTLTGILQTKAS